MKSFLAQLAWQTSSIFPLQNSLVDDFTPRELNLNFTKTPGAKIGRFGGED